MLKDSNYIDGTLAEELNKLCGQYDQLKTAYNEAEEAFNAVKDRIREICTQKDNETSKYQVVMTVTADSVIIDTKAIKEKYPEIAKECVKPKKGSRSIKDL